MKLNFWNYLVIGSKAVFGGVPSVICYLAKLLNEKVLSKCNAEELIKWAKAMVALADFCDRLIELFMDPVTLKREATESVSLAVRSLGDKLLDGTVTNDEITEAIADIRSAVAACKQAFKARKHTSLAEPSLAELIGDAGK